MIGTELEGNGWRQCSIIRSNDVEDLVKSTQFEEFGDLVLIAVSQSCDIASNNLDLEPCVEFIVGHLIDTSKKACENNSNPRILHLPISRRTETQDLESISHVEILAPERLRITKSSLGQLTPDPDRRIPSQHVTALIGWLVGRYSRPARPTEFNTRLNAATKDGKKLRDIAKKLNSELVGIYVEINPDAELLATETYRVNLLGLLPAAWTGNRDRVTERLEILAGSMKLQLMDVATAVLSEDEVSVATLRRFKRFHFDDLSIRDGQPMPIDP